MWYRERSYWLLPLILLLIGVAVLFAENLLKVTEAPDENISRDWQLGKTSAKTEPFIHPESNGYMISYFSDGFLIENRYDHSWAHQSDNRYPIDHQEFSRVFNDGEEMFYSKANSLHQGGEGELFTRADKFSPTESHLFILKDEQLIQINRETLETKEVLKLDKGFNKVMVKENEGEVYTLIHRAENNEYKLEIYRLSEEGYMREEAAYTFSVTPGETIREIAYDVEDDKLGIVLATHLRQGSSKHHYYFALHELKDRELSLNKIQAEDPFGSGQLNEWSDLELSLTDKGATILFAAHGATQTTYNDGPAFNIYEMTINESQSEVTRISNTSERSQKPTRVDEDTVLWMDGTGDYKEIKVASSKYDFDDKAAGWSRDDLLKALGKTLAMSSYAPLTIFVTLMWYIGPFLYLFIIIIGFHKAIEDEKSWVLYGAFAIYIVSAGIWYDLLFTERLMNRLPVFLDFPGSSFALLVMFGLLSFFLMRAEAGKRDWGVVLKFTYFVTVHILLIAVFIGPYLL
ncbi:hypothetical protein GCM10007216_29630 [Thalassobacillus devorans]|uniref:Uncharacterized protein n=1 Tax=Thalassobacillus devorans TaxID=279813 RepID=A0ABQ1PGQ0_9BACI|nr:hypothetical protein [Thalassobacillus devorans]NIK29467.1 hypothetical protein [Thalassobacillus devorans]GGC96905.1 hypothetical protein GCM10007216_29630 [Thalassobacillus devorans]